MQDSNAKQQIVERLKSSTNILVTVNSNPSVDELSAALGFTLMLNKMDKHATAVFSGSVPSALNFLQPDKTFESTVDSLRDFIIALDKDKADRLRYKVEDDVVRVFITPYRTTISEKDLVFSQGDFNVELIVALGVEKREDLDKAIVAHGRILHDATVVTVNTRNEKNSLGSIDWQDSNASSLCEMLMSLSEALQPNLLDEQISTALLTGIVAATERFSNQHTTPKVMTMSAQLMAAGANQQLIATKLEETHVIPSEAKDTQASAAATSMPVPGVDESSSTSLQKTDTAQDKPKADGEMHITHTQPPKAQESNLFVELAPAPAPVAPVEAAPPVPISTPAPELPSVPTAAPVSPATPPSTPSLADILSKEPEPAAEKDVATKSNSVPHYDVEKELTDKLNAQLPKSSPAASFNYLSQALSEEGESEVQQDDGAAAVTGAEHAKKNDEDGEKSEIIHDSKPSWMGTRIEPPTLGSPLTATSQQALDDSIKAQEADHQHTILSHDEQQLVQQQPFVPQPADFGLKFEEAPIPQPLVHDELAEAPTSSTPPFLASDEPSQKTQTIEELEAQAHAVAKQQLEAPPALPTFEADKAREAVDAAFTGATFTPANNPLQSLGSQPLGSVDHSDAVTAPPPPPAESVQAPQFTPAELPPMPDFSTLPPLPGEAPSVNSPFVDPLSALPAAMPSTAADPAATVAAPQDIPSSPGQFRIPGQ